MLFSLHPRYKRGREGGYNPMEVLEGAVPNKHLFREKIAEAKKQRPEKNRKGKFCEVCA